MFFFIIQTLLLMVLQPVLSQIHRGRGARAINKGECHNALESTVKSYACEGLETALQCNDGSLVYMVETLCINPCYAEITDTLTQLRSLGCASSCDFCSDNEVCDQLGTSCITPCSSDADCGQCDSCTLANDGPSVCESDAFTIVGMDSSDVYHYDTVTKGGQTTADTTNDEDTEESSPTTLLPFTMYEVFALEDIPKLVPWICATNTHGDNCVLLITAALGDWHAAAAAGAWDNSAITGELCAALSPSSSSSWGSCVNTLMDLEDIMGLEPDLRLDQLCAQRGLLPGVGDDAVIVNAVGASGADNQAAPPTSSSDSGLVLYLVLVALVLLMAFLWFLLLKRKRVTTTTVVALRHAGADEEEAGMKGSGGRREAWSE